MRSPTLAVLAMTAFLLTPFAGAQPSPAPAAPLVFPSDPRAILNVKTELGAVGDGVADDTDALQKAIETCGGIGQPNSRMVFIPRGTYRITRQLVFRPAGSDGKEGSMIGPWIFGEDQARTIIMLAPKAEGFTNPDAPRAMIRAISRPDGAKMNADFFDRTLANLTLDTGDNPGAIGIQFYSNNTGDLRRVIIRGNGVCGLDLGFVDQNGPLLVEDVEIIGYRTGINLDYGINSQTLSGVRITGADVGVRHRRQIATLEKLEVVGARIPVQCLDGGTLAIVGANFTGGKGVHAAIELSDKPARLYVRDLVTQGYTKAIAGGAAPSGDVAEARVREYSSHGITSPDPASKAGGLFLSVPQAPEVPWESNPDRWVCANDFGMTSGAGKEIADDDDATALQKAIDHAAAKGASTVYIIGGKRGDPNWYILRSDVRVHGSVRRLIGLGFVRLIPGTSTTTTNPAFPENMPKIIVDDEPGAAPAVAFEHLQVFSSRPGYAIDVRAKSRPVVIRASTPVVIARTGSRVFLTNVGSGLHLEPQATIVARHLNSESSGKSIHNDNGLLYIVGFKTEKAGTKILTSNGGKTEVFGSLIYNNTGDKDGLPCIEVRDAACFSGGFQEVHFGGKWYGTPVKLTQAGQTFTLGKRPWMSWSAMRAGE